MVFRFPWFVDEWQKHDDSLYQLVANNIELAMGPGALDEKTKLLISLALDAFKGSGPGVKALTEQARQQGASQEEIQETLRIAYLMSSMECLKASLEAYTHQKS